MSLLLAAMLQAGMLSPGRAGAGGEIPPPWHVVRLSGTKPTAYRLARVADSDAIEATVDSSMAALVRPIAVDLSRTPILCWRWFVQNVVAKGDLGKKSGNDFAARIYVGFDMPDSALDAGTRMKLGIARTIFGRSLPDAAVTYVWDNRHPIGTRRRSPYTDRQQLIVAHTSAADAGMWVTERADVAADFAQAFAGKPGKPVQLAVAADGDNTKSKGRAAFADIQFVRRDQSCPR